jgi:uncharacterized protein
MEKSRLVQITRQGKIAAEDFTPMINTIYEQIWQKLLPPQILTDDLTSRVAGNVVTPPDAPVPDCQTCGACCAAMLSVGVLPDEKVSAADAWDIIIKSEKGETIVDRFVRRDDENFSCVALEGAVGETVSCRIYENRPRVCRSFEAGSDRCHGLRRAYGLEPFLTIEEMLDALEKLEARPARKDAPDAIINVEFAAEEETGNIEIKVLLGDNSIRKIHVFEPDKEVWRQFEFYGLTLRQANELIASRSSFTQKP